MGEVFKELGSAAGDSFQQAGEVGGDAAGEVLGGLNAAVTGILGLELSESSAESKAVELGGVRHQGSGAAVGLDCRDSVECTWLGHCTDRGVRYFKTTI